jgi:hypothetical protein
VLVSPSDTVQTLVDKMLQVQQDWEVLGGSSKGPGTVDDEADSSTDDARDKYVLLHAPPPPPPC